MPERAAPPQTTPQRLAWDQSCSCWRRPYFATAQVPIVAKSATTTADGTLELVPPGVVEVMFGPNTASNSTVSHITVIASDAHISVIRSQAKRPSTEGSCGIALISAPFLQQRQRCTPWPGGRPRKC